MRALVLTISLGCGADGAPAKIEQARSQVDNLAHSAYPRWIQQHPDAPCPSRLTELGEPTDDPWGTPLRFACVDGMGIVVSSAGPDRKPESADDISSRQRGRP